MIELGSIAPPAIWALVPVKSPVQTKTRLAGVLSAAERARLQKAMLEDVIGQLAEVRGLTGTAIVGPDEGIRALALSHGCKTFNGEPQGGGLNRALAYGVEELRKCGADLIAIVPGDVPALDPAELDHAIRTAMEEHALVVVPDRTAAGTNALIFPVGHTPRFCFGEDSFRHHMHDCEGRTRSLPLESLARDIDRPADLEAIRRDFGKGVAPNTSACLAACGFLRSRLVEEERR